MTPLVIKKMNKYKPKLVIPRLEMLQINISYSASADIMRYAW